jgi:GAF domain-containing protein
MSLLRCQYRWTLPKTPWTACKLYRHMGSLQSQEWNEKLAAILTISQKMNSERDLGALLDLIAREATNVLLCDRASIFLLDRERNELWSKVALGSDEILRFDASRGLPAAPPPRARPSTSKTPTAIRSFTTPLTIRPATARATCWR